MRLLCQLYFFYSIILYISLDIDEFFIIQVDAAVLHYQNQRLVRQLDIQKHELHDLETKIKELKDKQTSYDDMLITVNQLWNKVFFLHGAHLLPYLL